MYGDHAGKILAIASGGGHWVQLLRLRPAFQGHVVIYATVDASAIADLSGCLLYTFPDASRKNPWAFFHVFSRILTVLVKERPTTIVTTGSAPGLVCVILGRLLGIRSLWIDSIANCRDLSTSGLRARFFATKCVTQWKNVARRRDIEYWGSVL